MRHTRRLLEIGPAQRGEPVVTEEPTSQGGPARPVSGERRWPMVAAALAAGVLHELLPASFRLGPHWVYPAFLVIFLIVLIVGDPGRIDRDSRWLRVTTGLMIGLITLVNAVAAARLVLKILTAGSFESATELFVTGALVWLINVITFALWFWDLDGGGAAVRAARPGGVNRALIFPEMTLAEFVPVGWFPQFADYLALSFNTAMAFSPTDVSAVRRWAKLMMICESMISLVLATLVVARAVNIL
jgi:uncharacterized membrane protein